MRLKLYADHIQKLTSLEKKLYAELIGDVQPRLSKRDLFVSKALKYHEGDETVLPFPECSKQGRQLTSLWENIRTPAAKESVVFEVKVPEYATLLKEKLRELGAYKTYTVSPETLTACIYNSSSAFQYFRDKTSNPGILKLNGLNPNKTLICALEPPIELVNNNTEYEVVGMYSNGTRELLSPLAVKLAHLGLTEVQGIDEDRMWTYQQS